MKENNWFDPFYIQSHLSEEESNIQKNVRDFCNNELKPTVVERNRKNMNLIKASIQSLGHLEF